MVATYSTSQIAKSIGIHPNTVRLYEKMGLITQPKREANGYRVFTELQMKQFKLARVAFQIEVLQNGLRKMVVEIVKLSAACDFEKATELIKEYLKKIKIEQDNAEYAIKSVKEMMSGLQQERAKFYKRKETAEHLKISVDTLRNWEMNGLIIVKRKKNGYRVYSEADMTRLKIIRSLRCANYSLEAILRMLQGISRNPDVNIKEILDTPKKSDDIITVCDNLISSLKAAEKNAIEMLSHIEGLAAEFGDSKM